MKGSAQRGVCRALAHIPSQCIFRSIAQVNERLAAPASPRHLASESVRAAFPVHERLCHTSHVRFQAIVPSSRSHRERDASAAPPAISHQLAMMCEEALSALPHPPAPPHRSRRALWSDDADEHNIPADVNVVQADQSFSGMPATLEHLWEAGKYRPTPKYVPTSHDFENRIS